MADRTGDGLRVLWIATKAPSPPIDGGRLLVERSLAALRDRGVVIRVAAPDRGSPKSWSRAVWRAVRTGLPVPVARHVDGDLVRRVEEAVSAFRPHLVHVEQAQALPQARPALRGGVPGVLRAQNLESDLWRQVATARFGSRAGTWLARGYARWEGEAVARLPLTLALTEEDRRELERLSGGRGRVSRIPVPFPPESPAGEPRAGNPALSLFVGRGWPPTREGAEWFLRRVWPSVRSGCPEARLHVFGEIERGSEGSGVTFHPAPAESRSAFPEGALFLVPLHVGSGIRMKILEAWSRGLPVVATSRAVRGLRGEDGVHWIARDDPEEMAAAVTRLAGDPEARRHLVASGRLRLREDHSPEAFASSYLEAVRRLVVR